MSKLGVLMKEEYLHFVYRTKLLGNSFRTVSGESIEILEFGIHNHNSGPDFLEAKIKLEDKIWAGQIEFHVKSSDWIKHKHQFDSNYNNVIAHFVYEHDQDIKSGEYNLPTVELKSLIDENHFSKYDIYLKSKNWIACENEINTLDDFVIFQQKEKALINRLSRKSQNVVDLIDEYNGDRKKVFNMILFKAFGTKVNQAVFQKLGELYNWKMVGKLNHDRFKFQAYLYGISGMLSQQVEDIYFLKLQEEYSYLKHQYNLTEINYAEWKFSTMRPFNLPTVRLAQLSKVLFKSNLYSEKSALDDIKSHLNIELDDYWKEHYMFGRKGKKPNPGLTKDFIDLLTINVFVPFVFSIGIVEGNQDLKKQAISWLEDTKPEKNTIVQNWKKLGIKLKSAFDSQALIEQKNEFCKKNLCLQCKIGQKLLKG